MTREEFDNELGRLVILKGMPGDSDPYWESLRDIPMEVIHAAMGHALRTRVWFPTPAEIRHDCDAAKPARAVAPTSRMVPLDGGIPVTIQNPFGGDPIVMQVCEEPDYACGACRDTGVVSYACGEQPQRRWPWLPRQICQRRKTHGEHDWSGPCACVETNPRIAARKEAQRQRYAQEPETVR